MNSRLIGSIKLVRDGSQAAELVFSVRETLDGKLAGNRYVTVEKFTSKPATPRDMGSYDAKSLSKMLEVELTKGFEVVSVNGKPFVSGDISDALTLLENGNDWNAVKTAQPNQRIKPRDVKVTFDEGQFAPVW